MTVSLSPDAPDTLPQAMEVFAEMRQLRDDFARFLLSYKFGMEEVSGKLRTLQEEFGTVHHYNPIEHVSTRLKTPESLLEKVQRTGCGTGFDHISRNITDIAGVRVTCSFVSDVYRVFELITGQDDVTVLAVKDYIENPKPNGYRSLHVIVEVPVYLSDGTSRVPVEIQLRTVAMDFWASLEHKIYYKYARQIPQHLHSSLHQAAATAAKLDADMEALHVEIHGPDRYREPATVEGMELSETVIAQLIGDRDLRAEALSSVNTLGHGTARDISDEAARDTGRLTGT